MEKIKTIPGYASLIAGVLFSCRYIYHFSEGTLHYQAQNPSVFLQTFFIVQLLMIAGLAGVAKEFHYQPKLKRLITLSCIGLLWIAFTRTVEAYGARGPWGLFGSPGLIVFCIATFLAGKHINKNHPFRAEGKILITIAVFHIIGSFGSLIIYNALSGGTFANKVASSILQVSMTCEGIAWIVLGKTILKAAYTTRLKCLH